MHSDSDSEIDVKYPVLEIFDSIQGEGSWLGIPCTFIRFSGCNLRCEWCDTKDSWERSEDIPIGRILNQIHYQHIILTGGEPTLYDLTPLVKIIKQKNHNAKIAIETNGTREVPDILDWIVVSPKPQSKYQITPIPNELKYVVDSNFHVDVIPERYKDQIPIWLQPNGYNLEESMHIAYQLVLQYEYLRLGVQLHKLYHLK